ncbi:MAG TPA: helix-turn-helix domain-containing protein, partial [Haliangium sp.]|nr:helix-turn-helix domain-containing protein [Haliangium sp.]
MKPHSPTASRSSGTPGEQAAGRAAGSDRAAEKAEKADKANDKAAGGDKRERILDAAERVFARQGFYQSRVSEIARDAGVADGTIYLYFKSKDDLLISLFESRMERVNQRLALALA